MISVSSIISPMLIVLPCPGQIKRRCIHHKLKTLFPPGNKHFFIGLMCTMLRRCLILFITILLWVVLQCLGINFVDLFIYFFMCFFSPKKKKKKKMVCGGIRTLFLNFFQKLKYPQSLQTIHPKLFIRLIRNTIEREERRYSWVLGKKNFRKSPLTLKRISRHLENMMNLNSSLEHQGRNHSSRNSLLHLSSCFPDCLKV
jgi:hypothetical protein